MSNVSLDQDHSPPSSPATATDTAGANGYARVAGEHAHPNAWRYVQIATALAVLTLLELGVYYSKALHPVLVPILLSLSATKFALVVLFYMHLKFDSRIFSALFTLGLLIAGSIITALILLFRSYFFAAITG